MRRRLPGCAVLALLSLPLSAQIPIDGRVRDSGGVALAGVRVEVRPILSSWEQGSRELDGKSIEPAAATVTGADGRFSLPAPGEGMWEVVVSGEGYVPQRIRLTPLTAAETLYPVKLRRDAGVRARVEGPDGKPLAGARVLGREAEDLEDKGQGWQAVPRIASTGADGVARLPAARGESLELFATAPGFPVQEGAPARAPREVTIRLAPGAPRRVEAPETAVLRDLRTSLVLARGGAEVVIRGEPWLLLETEDGVRVRFAVPEKGGAVRVEVPAPAVLPGNVIDSAARQPVAGAWVWPRNDAGRFVRSDAQGGYQISGDDLEIAAAGFLPEIVDDSIPWPAGGLPAVALDPEVFVSGTVEEAEGKPAAGAEVAVFSKSGSWIPQIPRAPRVRRVSAEGTVRIGGLRPGATVELMVTGPGLAPAWLHDGWLKARDNRFAAVLSRGSRVEGRIQDGQGAPVAEAEVWIEPAAGMAGVWYGNDPGGEARPFTTTAPDGGFAFADLAPGWYEMKVRRPGAAVQRLPRFEVKSGSGAADLGALRLDGADVLTARVVDADGRPVAGADVSIGALSDFAQFLLGSEYWPAAVSGADGGVSLRASRWQALELIVCAPGFVPLGMSVRRFLPEEPLVLTLERGAAVSGRLTGADGLPAPGWGLVLKPLGETGLPLFHQCSSTGWSTTDDAGRFRFTGVKPGLYSLRDRRLELAAGESREVTLPPEEAKVRGASFSGRLLGKDGQPVPGARIEVDAYEDHGSYWAMDDAVSRTDADGRYRLEFGKPGMKLDSSPLEVSRHGQLFFTSSHTWPGPAATEADGRFDIPLESFPRPLADEAPIALTDQRHEAKPLATVAGRILGLEPGELAGVKVTAIPDGTPSPGTTVPVDAQGSYRLEGLAPELWRIRAEAGDRAAFDTVRIPEGETRLARDLVFPRLGEVRGRIETPGSEPVAGATVRLRHRASALDLQLPDVEIRTGSDGGYSVRLPAGGYEVTASKEGFVPSPQAPADFAIVEAGDTDDVNLWLQPAIELRGRLTGLPPDQDEIEIEATLADGTPGYKPPRKGRMVAEGRYVIPGLGPGTWEVKAVCSVFGKKLEATGRVVIAEEATEAVLDLAFPGRP